MILTAQTESALPTREAGRRVSAEDCVIWILTAALSTVSTSELWERGRYMSLSGWM